MQKAIQHVADLDAVEQSQKHVRSFNIHKLQAVLCIAASAFVSVALIAWAIKSFL